MLLNIALNAIKFTKKGIIKFEAELIKEKEGEQNSYKIKISVTDQGIGISDEDLPHIFTTFYRSKNKKNRLMNSRGHGLGLHICKNICESLGGDIQVESTLGVGSKFTVSIRVYSVQQKLREDKQLVLFIGSDNGKSSLGSMEGPEYTASAVS